MRTLIKRYREPLFVVGLLVLSFVGFFAHAKRGAQLNALDRAVIAFTAPVQKLIVNVAYGTIDAFQAWVALRGVREENLELRKENVRARLLEQQATEQRAENERLRGLLGYASEHSSTRMVPARVVAVGASPHSHTLRIALGADDGVVKGASVVCPQGVVGTVQQLTGSYADVQLIVSPLAAVPVMTQRNRSRSTLKGTGDVTRAMLDYVQRNDDVREGDVILTVGGPGFFPQGLLVGTVRKVDHKPSGMFLSAEVTPAVDFARLDEVLVVLEDKPAQNDAPPVPTAPGQQQGMQP